MRPIAYARSAYSADDEIEEEVRSKLRPAGGHLDRGEYVHHSLRGQDIVSEWICYCSCAYKRDTVNRLG
jgi:hypothetical protein